MRSRHLAALAAGVATVLAGLPGSAAAAAPTPDPLSPYVAAFDAQIPGPAPWESTKLNSDESIRTTFRREYQSGVRWSYTWVPWSAVEKTRGVYSFTELDNYVKAAHDEGILLRLQVTTGDWSYPQPWNVPLRENPNHRGENLNVPAVDLQPAVDFWAALVKRYHPGGDLAVEQGWSDGYGVSRWEFENEPACIVWWGSWGRVPKDFAEFVARVSRRVRPIDPSIKLSAPALAQTDGNCAQDGLDGLNFLKETLDADQSEWQSTTYTASAEHPAMGPFVDAISWHFDNANLSDGSVPGRAAQIRSIVDSYATQPTYPTRAGTPLWYSEGSALGYNTDNAEFATAQVQLMTMLLAAGVQTVNLEAGTQLNDSWESSPMYGAQRALTRFLPRAGEVSVDSGLEARVQTYLRVDPASAARTHVLWATDSTTGVGPDFTVNVPVSTPTALVVSSTDWAVRTEQVSGGVVPVTLHSDDPSPVVIVAEQPTEPAPLVPEAPVTALLPLLTVVALGGHVAWRRRLRGAR
jgi:hypothetical protein